MDTSQSDAFEIAEDDVRDLAYEILETRRPIPTHLRETVREFLASGDDPLHELFACIAYRILERDDAAEVNLADAAYVAAVALIATDEDLVA